MSHDIFIFVHHKDTPFIEGITSNEALYLSKIIAAQCKSYDSFLRKPIDKYESLIVSIINQALTDLSLLGSLPAPSPADYMNERAYRIAIADWNREQMNGADAYRFLMTERLDPYAIAIGLEPEWIRGIIRKWISIGVNKTAEEKELITSDREYKRTSQLLKYRQAVGNE